MDSTSLNPQSGKSLPSIELRKTFARLSFYSDQIMQGKNHEEILQLMELTESEWKQLLAAMINISSLKDFDAKIVAAGEANEFFIGGTALVKDNKVLLRF